MIAFVPAILLALTLLTSSIVCVMKGKGLMVALSPWLSIVGALRVAKPDSYWARHYYSLGQLAVARQRFPAEQALVEERDELLAAWGPEISDEDMAGMDRITRRALKKAGRLPGT